MCSSCSNLAFVYWAYILQTCARWLCLCVRDVLSLTARARGRVSLCVRSRARARCDGCAVRAHIDIKNGRCGAHGVCAGCARFFIATQTLRRSHTAREQTTHTDTQRHQPSHTQFPSSSSCRRSAATQILVLGFCTLAPHPDRRCSVASTCRP